MRKITYIIFLITFILFFISQQVIAQEINDEEIYNKLKLEFNSSEKLHNSEKNIEDILKINMVKPEIHSQQYIDISNDYSNFYETEPNYLIKMANIVNNNYSGQLNYRIYGTITDKYYDLDYYRFDVTTNGIFDIFGVWLDNYYKFGWEDDLIFGLLDSSGETIAYSKLKGSGTSKYQDLTIEVSPGTYYIVVLQTSDYEYLYVGEAYGLDLKFESSTVSVTSVSLNKTNLTINKDNSEVLIATVLPTNATNKGVSWSSSNMSVATVDTNGKVTGVDVGKAIITATTIDGGFKAICEINVLVGDINGDGNVNVTDLLLISQGYGSKRGDGIFNELYDLNNDSVINIFDLVMLVKKFK